MPSITYTDGKYFRPLTGYEIEERRPLILKVGRRSFVYHLYSPLKTAAFFEDKDRILCELDKVKENPKLAVSIVVSIADLLWRIADKRPRFGYRAFVKYSLYHSAEILEAFYDLCHYQTHLFFLLQRCKAAPLFQLEEFSPIGGGLSQSAKVRKDKHTSILHKLGNMRKTKLSIKKK